MKLWENPEVWEERDKLDSYLYTVVRNHIYNLLKHKNVEENYKEAAAQKMEWEELGLPTPDDDLQLKELELLIHLTVGRMPEQRRQTSRGWPIQRRTAKATAARPMNISAAMAHVSVSGGQSIPRQRGLRGFGQKCHQAG